MCAVRFFSPSKTAWISDVNLLCVFFLVFQLGWLVTAVEWCVFVCNHNAGGEHWKNSFSTSPCLIQAVMANGKKKKITEQMWCGMDLRLTKKVILSPIVPGFRTPLGMWVVSGLHCLPLWLYIYQWGLLTSWLHLPVWIQVFGTFLLVTGRLLALFVEVQISNYRNSISSN